MTPPELPSLPLSRPIGEGSHLRIIAPAGPFDRARFDSGVAWLRRRYEVTFSEEIHTRQGYLAGSDGRRLAELHGALSADDVDGILCARGGFGCTRLLPGLDLDMIRSANKTIIGFSDITALHAQWFRAGVRSIHAPMVAALANTPEPVRDAWIASVENQVEESTWKLEPVSRKEPASTRGYFFGGNLAVLGALIGTPYAPPLENVILFIEDVGERPYRVDRLLTTLKQAGWFERVAGLVLGSFTEGDPGPDGVMVDEVFHAHFHDAPFPVLKGFPAGHIDANEPISFGSIGELKPGTLTLWH